MARKMNVIPYDENWSIFYQEEKSILQSIFSESIIDIQHFGSTSIQGMTAKPTIDIMIIVKNIDEVDKYNEEMIKHDYIVRGENGIPRRRYFIRLKEDGENHASHVHVYESDNPHVQDELMFRDFLRVNKEVFLQYETMKKVVSELYRYSPRQYEEAKYDCVMHIMQKARAHFAK